MIENKDDVIITPDQVPLDKMKYELMNNPTQQIVRRLLIAEAKILLGIIRGTFSGSIKIPEAEAQMDYNMLLEQGKAEKETVLNELKERLERMTPWKLMENQATMNEQLIKVLKNKPLGLFVR
jgi:C4-type Zn-finger protein